MYKVHRQQNQVFAVSAFGGHRFQIRTTRLVVGDPINASGLARLHSHYVPVVARISIVSHSV